MTEETIIVQSPGRINIIGEHTDYNDGFVLPGAIDKKTTVTLTPLPNATKCRITAKNLNESYEFDIREVKPTDGGWQNYVLGVIHELQELEADIGAFECEIEGNVPIGSGMSSSAALECCIAYALNEAFQLGIDKFSMVKAGQMAEHNYVGTKCGIMDQFASMMGRKDHVMLLDCRSLDFEYIPFDLGEYEVLLLNSKVSHSHATSAYNDRRADSEAAVAVLQQQKPEIKALRDVTMEELAAVKSQLPGKSFERARHVISENDRVLAAIKAMKAGNIQTVGELMYQSHDSLQHDYEVSCKELDYLVSLTRDKAYILGSRMMGGGFGGCSINLIHQDYTKQFIEEAADAYKDAYGIELEAYEVSIEDGTKRVG